MNRVIFYVVIMPLALTGALTLVVWSTSLPQVKPIPTTAGDVEWAKTVLATLERNERELDDDEGRVNALAASTSCPLHVRLSLSELPYGYKLLAIKRIGLRGDAKRIVDGWGDKDVATKLKADLETYAHEYGLHVVKVRALTAQLTKRDYGVTLDAYNAIKSGMSLSEVTEVIGDAPKEISRAGSFVTYVWGDKSGGIVAAFDGDRLVSKSQQGL